MKKLRFLALVLTVASLNSLAEGADEYGSNRDLTLYHTECTEFLTPGASAHQVQPWFHPDNPATADVDLTFMTHKFARAFTFAADGRHVLIHHDIYPDAEQLTLRSLDTAEKLTSLLWRSKTRRLFDLRSAAFDGDTRQVVALAENYFTDRTDAVLIWNGQRGDFDEHVTIAPIADSDFRDVYSGSHSFRTYISTEHPYYVRSVGRKNEVTGKDQLSVQIVDWRNKGLLNLKTTPENFMKVVQNEPINAAFRYAAVLLDDQKTIRLLPFDQIEKEMFASTPPVAGLLGRAGQAIAGLLGRMTSPKSTVPVIAGGSITGSVTGSVTVQPDFSADLVHESPVRKFVTSQWAPFAVSQTDKELQLWNTKTGQGPVTIAGKVSDFRVLDKIGLVVYAADGKLVLYSMFLAKPIAEFANFPYYFLNWRIDNREAGVAYVALTDGVVFEVRELRSELGVSYDVSDTKIRMASPMNSSYQSAVNTKKGRYLVQVFEDSSQIRERSLLLDVYSLDGSGRFVTRMEFPTVPFQSQFQPDPTGRTVVYTKTETETGILHLDRLLEERGF